MRLKEIISWLPMLGMCCLLVTLPFYYGYTQRYSLYGLAIFYLLDYFVNKRYTEWKWNSNLIVFVLMIVFFLLTPLHQLFDTTDVTPFYKHQMNVRYPFLIFGLVGFLGISDKINIRIVGAIMLLTGSCIFIYLFVTSAVATRFVNDMIGYFNQLRINQIYSHMVVNLYANLAIIAGYYMLATDMRKVLKVLTCVGMSLNVVMIVISEGRIGFITFLVCALVLIIYKLYRSGYRKAYIGVFFVIAALSCVFIALNKKMSVEKLSEDPRLVVWNYSWHLIKQHPISGYGLSTLSNEFVEQAFTDEPMNQYYIHGVLTMPEFVDVPRDMKIIHPHNAFLQTWLEHGIAGLFILIVFFAAFGSLIRLKPAGVYVFLTMLAILLQSITEPFGQHFQPMIVGLMILLWYYGNRREAL